MQGFCGDDTAFPKLAPRARQRILSSMNARTLSTACFVLGFLSIAASIVVWFVTGGDEDDTKAHAERFGIFIGLWAPTFFILSNRFDRYADKRAEGVL